MIKKFQKNKKKNLLTHLKMIVRSTLWIDKRDAHVICKDWKRYAVENHELSARPYNICYLCINAKFSLLRFVDTCRHRFRIEIDHALITINTCVIHQRLRRMSNVTSFIYILMKVIKTFKRSLRICKLSRQRPLLVVIVALHQKSNNNEICTINKKTKDHMSFWYILCILFF